MNYNYRSSMFGPIMIGAGLLVSGGLIAELANNKMYENTHKRTLVKAKKLDVNNDGLISLNELISHQNRHFQKLNLEEDSQTDEAESNARLVAMFFRMDSNSDGMLDDVEISKLSHRRNRKSHNTRGDFMKNGFKALDRAACKTKAACPDRPTLVRFISLIVLEKIQ